VSGPLSIVEDFDRREPWNDFVDAHPSGHFFQTWEWGELQDGLGGRPRRLAAVSDGRIIGCVQQLVFDSGERKFAYVPRGPVADPDDPCVSDLVDAVLEVNRREGVQFVRIEPQWGFDQDSADWFQQRGFAVARQFIMPLRTVLVDLQPSLDAIWSAFRSNTRNRIRLAEKLGVKVRVGGEDDLAAFVRLFEETTARHGLRRASNDSFFLADRLFGRRDEMRLFLARGEDLDLSGIIVFLGATQGTYLWGASSAAEAARRLNPNQLLHWTAMQWAKERGCRTYDLFGIPDYDEPVLEREYGRQTGGMWNLYRFKRGFGGRVHRHLGTFDYVF
jgi:peptidoglycan pentaglycine glycine transferase (the first glycine)